MVSMTSTQHPMANKTIRLASGAEAVLDSTGRVERIVPAEEVRYYEEMTPESVGCECEQDWNCPLHANRNGTWIETRYDGLPD